MRKKRSAKDFTTQGEIVFRICFEIFVSQKSKVADFIRSTQAKPILQMEKEVDQVWNSISLLHLRCILNLNHRVYKYAYLLFLRSGTHGDVKFLPHA